MADLLSPREAALRLGISYPTMKQWLYRGKLKAIKTPGGHYRIPEAELDSLLHKARRPETPKRQMLRTVSGRNQLVGRIVEIKTAAVGFGDGHLAFLFLLAEKAGEHVFDVDVHLLHALIRHNFKGGHGALADLHFHHALI